MPLSLRSKPLKAATDLDPYTVYGDTCFILHFSRPAVAVRWEMKQVSLYSDRAGDEDWLALVSAIETSADAGQTCLAHMINWALKRDAA